MSLISEKVNYIYQSFDKKREYYQTDYDRYIKLARMYWGVDYGHYPRWVVDQLLSEGRQAPQIPVMASKLDGLRGALLRNQFDVKYAPMSGNIDEMSLMLQDMYYSDKDSMGWDASYNMFLRDFLLQFGVEVMDISTKENILGNICFIPKNPILEFPDPNWKDNNGYNLREVDSIGYYTPEQLKEAFPDKAKELDELKLMDLVVAKSNKLVAQYGDRQSGVPYENVEAKWGDQHMVIEHHEMKTESRKWEYNLRDFVPFPETGFENGSKDDIIAKKHYVEQEGLDPNSEIRVIPQKNKIYYKTIVCPGLSSELTLFDGKHYIQIGRIPRFYASPATFGSQRRGVADLMEDVQTNTDRYIMMMQEILNKSARGSQIIDPMIVNNDAGKMEELVRNWNSSSYRFFSHPGVSQTGKGLSSYIHEINQTHIPQDLFMFNNLMESYADRYSYQTPSAEGRVESSKESGKLFQSKYEATIIARGIIDKELEIHQLAKAEAYMKQAKITYSGPEREFSIQGGKGTFKINRLVAMPDGSLGRERDISKLQRQRVIITPSQRGVDVRVGQRSMFSELKMNTRDPLMAAFYDEQIVSTFEMNDEQRTKAMAVLDLVEREAAMQKAISIKDMELKMQQMDSTAANMNAGMAAQGQPLETPVPGQEMSTAPTPVESPQVNPEQAVEGTPMQGAKGYKQLANIEKNIVKIK